MEESHVDEFEVTGHYVGVEESGKSDDAIETPYVGMTFGSSDEAKQYYERYAISKGFSTVTRSSNKGWRHCDRVTNVSFACLHFGSHKKKINEDVDRPRLNTSTQRGECKAQMYVKLGRTTMKWEVGQFCDEHNHTFVSPSKRALLKSNRNMPDAVKGMVERFRDANLQINKVKDIFGGDVIGFNDRRCWNHLRDIRQKLDVGDAQWVFNHFQRRQVENPQFYSAIQCDTEGRAVNFFWVDARSRMSYEQFGDVVSFDTTYKTNKYNMPFAPFTGVNHHFQTIQFGCGLLQDETEESFIWLFQTWKNAMGGKDPVSFITDSDLAMRAAVPKVFLTTRHRLCYWHIKKKFGEKLGHLYYKKSSFKREVKECLRFTIRIEDFKRRWDSLIEKYELSENSWLTGLYEDREAWVPVYNRTTFFAGLNTTGRSEGVNGFFKDHINRTTNLMDFVRKYEQALKTMEVNERNEDFESEQKNRIITGRSFILKHGAEIYTRKMFEKFRTQFFNAELYKADMVSGELMTYDVKFIRSKTNEEGDEHWIVKWNQHMCEGVCECHLYEFVGIPCAHILKVLSKLDVYEIPKCFINERWLKGANRFRRCDKEGSLCQEQVDAMNLSYLCQEATKWACVASQNPASYKAFLDGLRELGKKISEIIPDKVVEEDVSSESSAPCDSGDDRSSLQPILDPNVSQTKGRKKDEGASGKHGRQKDDGARGKHGRYVHPIEATESKKKRKCRSCNLYTDHDSRNCPQNPTSKKAKSLATNETS